MGLADDLDALSVDRGGRPSEFPLLLDHLPKDDAYALLNYLRRGKNIPAAARLVREKYPDAPVIEASDSTWHKWARYLKNGKWADYQHPDGPEDE